MATIPDGEIHVDEHGNFSMSKETLQSLTGYVEENEDDEKAAELMGRKDYCCHSTAENRCTVIRASNSASAAIKCMGHYAGRPVNSHRGNCQH